MLGSPSGAGTRGKGSSRARLTPPHRVPRAWSLRPPESPVLPVIDLPPPLRQACPLGPRDLSTAPSTLPDRSAPAPPDRPLHTQLASPWLCLLSPPAGRGARTPSSGCFVGLFLPWPRSHRGPGWGLSPFHARSPGPAGPSTHRTGSYLRSKPIPAGPCSADARPPLGHRARAAHPPASQAHCFLPRSSQHWSSRASHPSLQGRGSQRCSQPAPLELGQCVAFKAFPNGCPLLPPPPGSKPSEVGPASPAMLPALHDHSQDPVPRALWPPLHRRGSLRNPHLPLSLSKPFR